MISNPNQPDFSALWSGTAEICGTDADAVREELQTLCDSLRRQNESFPETPEELILVLLAALKNHE